MDGDYKMTSLTNIYIFSQKFNKHMYKLMLIVYFSPKHDKSYRNKVNRKECKIIATTGSIPMAECRKEMV